MAVRDDRSNVKQTTAGFRDPRHHICHKQIPIPHVKQIYFDNRQKANGAYGCMPDPHPCTP